MTFRILSLDGGGIRGVIAAQILQEVERQIFQQKGQYLHQYFDLIAGTSTGSILTAGIALGKKSEKLIRLYSEKGKYICPIDTRNFYQEIPSFIRPLIEACLPPKYTHDGLINVLRSQFLDIKIKDIERPIILILAYDTLYRNTTFFTNCHPDKGDRWYDDCKLWEICAASASAPTFFPPYKLEPVNKAKFGHWVFPHIDGGVCANNPALAALSLAMKVSQSSSVDAHTKKKYNLHKISKLEDIAILSIGTGQGGEPYTYDQIDTWRGLDWVKNLTDIFLEPTSEINSTICHQIMGGYESQRYLRLQFDLNERFKAKDHETYKDTRTVLTKNQRTNRFTSTKVSEDIDDAREKIITQLKDAAKKFVTQGRTYYSRNGDGPLVKKAITSFIENNSD